LGSLHRIKVLGRELQVRGTATPERVRKIEEYINRTVAELEASTKSNDSLGIAILALLNITEAFLELSADSENRGKTVDERITRMLRCIEDAVG
jgi:cell division protein ZapA